MRGFIRVRFQAKGYQGAFHKFLRTSSPMARNKKASCRNNNRHSKQTTFITDHSKQIMFITDPFVTDSFVTDHVDNGPLLNVCCNVDAKSPNTVPNTLCPFQPQIRTESVMNVMSLSFRITRICIGNHRKCGECEKCSVAI